MTPAHTDSTVDPEVPPAGAPPTLPEVEIADSELDHAKAAALREALGHVLDPELDRPITELEFVTEARVGGSGVRIRLRLPTYFCAPNFAFMMAADAYDAARAVVGDGAYIDVALLDHFASEQINAGVAAQNGFGDAFGLEALDELEELRAVFRRKAHTASVDRVARTLLRAGVTLDELHARRLGEVPESEDLERLRRRRDELGLPSGPGSLLLLDDDGGPVPPARIETHLRFARSVRVSAEWNRGFCSSLLHTRYDQPPTAAAS